MLFYVDLMKAKQNSDTILKEILHVWPFNCLSGFLNDMAWASGPFDDAGFNFFFQHEMIYADDFSSV